MPDDHSTTELLADSDSVIAYVHVITDNGEQRFTAWKQEYHKNNPEWVTSPRVTFPLNLLPVFVQRLYAAKFAEVQFDPALHVIRVFCRDSYLVKDSAL